MNPFDVINTALNVGVAVARTIATAIQAGDTSTLEALNNVLPSPEILKARDLALQAKQQQKAREELT
jgi:hypothetical protein